MSCFLPHFTRSLRLSPPFCPPSIPSPPSSHTPLLINTTKPQKLTPLLLPFSLSLSLSVSLSLFPHPSPSPTPYAFPKTPHLSAVSGMTGKVGNEGKADVGGQIRERRERKKGGGIFLKQCFKTDDQLVVGYSIVPAFG